MYNWQFQDWPQFTYSISSVEDKLHAFAEKTGSITGVLKALPEDTKMEAIVEVMVSEAVKTSEIEGEFLSRKDVMSSIRNELGLDHEPGPVADKRSKGIGQLMIDVRNTYQAPLTTECLFLWHTMLMGGQHRIKVGAWREHTEPMQVISGAAGRETVHYEAPPSAAVPAEMDAFITWFNDTAPGGKYEITKAPVRSAIAYLYFESIHPFEDGNGRIGRAIAEKALSQSISRPVLLSLSRVIELNRNDYYKALQTAQASLEITPWIAYFVGVVFSAQEYAESQIDFALHKTKFFDRYKEVLTERQLKIVSRMLEEGSKGFEGGMSAGKYASIAKTSKATATRDIQDMLEKGVFIPFGTGGGRSTRYQLNI